LDLNLIRIFVAIYEEGTVTQAAARLHMAQPSVSQALNRLRRTVGEPLFVRSGRRIAPTRTAHQLYEEIGALPAKADSAVRRLSNFAPTSTTETFHVALTDLGQTVFLPILYAALMDEAPQCKLNVINLDALNIVDKLQSGTVDLALSSTRLSTKVRTSTVMQDQYCCIAKPDRFTEESLSLDDFMAIPRIVVKDSIGHTVVEAELPPPPPGSLMLPAFSAIPAVLSKTHLVAFVPRAIVPLWTKVWPLRYWPLPGSRFNILVRAHSTVVPRSAASAWFTEWAISILQENTHLGYL